MDFSDTNTQHNEKIPTNFEIEHKIQMTEYEKTDIEMAIMKKKLEDKGEKETKMIKAVYESALDSKIHGISNIVRVDSKILRLIWIAFFLTCASYCTYLITITLVAYLEFKVIPMISIKYETPTKFPAVDICNLDAYDGNTARDALNEALKEQNITVDKFIHAKDYVNNASNVFKSNFEKRAHESSSFSLFEKGFYLSQMLMSCKFQGLNCSKEDFYFYHDYDYGSCFRFNGGKTNRAGETSNITVNPIKTVTTSGWENGLQLELFIGNVYEQQQYNFKSGVRLFVHNQSIVPFPNDDGIDVAAGQQTNIAVSRQFIKKLGKPYSDCLDTLTINWHQNDVLDFMRKAFEFEEYDQIFCIKACQQLYNIQSCKCYDAKFPISENLNYNATECFKGEELECLSNANRQFFKSGSIECYSKCNEQCEAVIYGLTTAFANYPSEWYASLLLNNTNFVNFVVNNTANKTMSAPTFNSLEKTILMVNVYYDELFFTNIDDEPKLPFENFIALVGGHLGLFLGMSILSLIEIVEIIFLIVYYSTIRYFKRK